MNLKQQIGIAFLCAKFRLLSLLSNKKAAKQAFDLFCTPQVRNTKQLPPFFEQAEHLRFDFQQFDIRGYRWNRGAARKALLVHGFESSVVNFERFALGFVEQGYEVLAFDAPAHGRSSGKQVNAIVYRDFLKHIYTEFGPVQTFLAHSFGGLCVSMALAELSPPADTKLVLIAPATETRTALDQFFGFLHLNDPEVRKEFEDIIVKVSGYPPAWFSIGRAIKKLNASILWVHDEDDTTTPLLDAFEIRKANYPNIEFLITNGLGHRRIYRDEDVIRKILDFI
jgi:pimeloyl-ACP methyl ester carboxylesterase